MPFVAKGASAALTEDWFNARAARGGKTHINP
jgi:hypothetical protein